MSSSISGAANAGIGALAASIGAGSIFGPSSGSISSQGLTPVHKTKVRVNCQVAIAEVDNGFTVTVTDYLASQGSTWVAKDFAEAMELLTAALVTNKLEGKT